MTEKEAIETLETMKKNIDKKYLKTRNSVAIETVLNLLEKKEKRLNRQFKLLQKKDKEIATKDTMIDLMSDKLVEAHEWFYSEFDNYTKEDFKQYFENKVNSSEQN